MARKTTESATTTKRTRKAASPVLPGVQAATESLKPVRKSGKSTGFAPVNIEEAIRVRAYELYLQRRATAGGDIGDENQDWLVAEREILSRSGGHGQHTA